MLARVVFLLIQREGRSNNLMGFKTWLDFARLYCERLRGGAIAQHIERYFQTLPGFRSDAEIHELPWETIFHHSCVTHLLRSIVKGGLPSLFEWKRLNSRHEVSKSDANLSVL
jgi:hypothetical protein